MEKIQSLLAASDQAKTPIVAENVLNDQEFFSAIEIGDNVLQKFHHLRSASMSTGKNDHFCLKQSFLSTILSQRRRHGI